MSKYLFAIETTGRPFSGVIPDSAWSLYSEHTTLSAAQKALKRLYAEWNFDHGAWGDHARIIALRPTTLVRTHYCLGYIDHHGHAVPCPDWAVEEVSYHWGEAEPEPSESKPLGWYDRRRCFACHQRSGAERRLLEDNNV